MLKQQISWSDYKKVPILLVKSSNGYQPLTDSTMIVSALATYLKDRTFNIEDIANFYPSISYVDVDGKRKTDIMNKYFIMNEDESEKSRRLNFEYVYIFENVLMNILIINFFLVMKENGENGPMKPWFMHSHQMLTELYPKL